MTNRHERGLARLRALDGSGMEQGIAGLGEIAPDFPDLVIEFAFGDVLARPGLDIRTRQIATVAALTALGTAGPQLRAHIAASLRVGVTREEIVEAIMQMAVYAGFPAALNGLAAAREAFAANAA
ncbi:MAG: carboxymuconolactone decarboxylase family protein [Dongiaceae bacterium]